MNVPAQITYRDNTQVDDIDALVRRKIDHLEQVCDHLSSCRVSVEHPQRHINSGSGYRVRVDLAVPPGHELASRTVCSPMRVTDSQRLRRNSTSTSTATACSTTVRIVDKPENAHPV